MIRRALLWLRPARTRLACTFLGVAVWLAFAATVLWPMVRDARSPALPVLDQARSLRDEVAGLRRELASREAKLPPAAPPEIWVQAASHPLLMAGAGRVQVSQTTVLPGSVHMSLEVQGPYRAIVSGLENLQKERPVRLERLRLSAEAGDSEGVLTGIELVWLSSRERGAP